MRCRVVKFLRCRYIFSHMAKELPLADFHKSNGAVFAEDNGWMLPGNFGAPQAEYHAVRSAAALLDCSNRGLLQLTGPDRFTYLQGLVSNDVTALKPNQGIYAAILNQQGKVLGDTRVLCSENSLYLDLWEPIKDKILEHLNRYLVADEVEIADRTSEYGTLSLQGPCSGELAQRLFEADSLPDHLLGHRIVKLKDTFVCLVRSDRTRETGFDLIAPGAALAQLAEELTEIGKNLSVKWVGSDALNTVLVEDGIPRYGIDFSEDNLLLEVGLNNAVSFTKGCYLGQEIIERVRSRGHVNKKICGFAIAGNIPAHHGDPIRVDEKSVGTVTSSVCSPKLRQAVALGYLHRDHWQPGTPVTVLSDTGPLSATVTELPFAKA